MAFPPALWMSKETGGAPGKEVWKPFGGVLLHFLPHTVHQLLRLVLRDLEADYRVAVIAVFGDKALVLRVGVGGDEASLLYLADAFERGVQPLLELLAARRRAAVALEDDK